MSPEANAFSIPKPPPLEQVSDAPVLQEREVVDPEMLSERQWSKDHMSEERSRLAVEIAEERYVGRHKLAELHMHVRALQSRLERSGQDSESLRTELETLEGQRVARANSLSGKVRSLLRIESSLDAALGAHVRAKHESLGVLREEHVAMAAELERSTRELVDTDESLVALREKITSHYSLAAEQMHRAVEQTMLRNNVFLVHTINEHAELRHNENSNVSKHASFEDDLDILLSLEPSVSASSVSPGVDEEGRVSGLWSHSGGVLISGGAITAAAMQDMGTHSLGIKERRAPGATGTSTADIDVVVGSARSSLPGEIGGYNELVVDNPKISGYFKPGAIDESGRFWAYSLDTRKNLEELHEIYHRSPSGYEYKDASEMFHGNLNRYRDRFNQIKEKGLPFYVMTSDRRFFEVLHVNENGSLTVGEELTPEQAAKSRAGLSFEKRKEIGTKLLHREVFRNQESYQEAAEIIEEL